MRRMGIGCLCTDGSTAKENRRRDNQRETEAAAPSCGGKTSGPGVSHCCRFSSPARLAEGPLQHSKPPSPSAFAKIPIHLVECIRMRHSKTNALFCSIRWVAPSSNLEPPSSRRPLRLSIDASYRFKTTSEFRPRTGIRWYSRPRHSANWRSRRSFLAMRRQHRARTHGESRSEGGGRLQCH